MIAEILAGAAECARGKVKYESDVLSLGSVCNRTGDGFGRADLDAHAAVDALVAVIGDASAVVLLGGHVLSGEILRTGLAEQIRQSDFDKRKFHFFIASLFSCSI